MSKYTIGLDVGGTKIAVGLVSKQGKIIKKIKIPTESKKGKERVLTNIYKATNLFYSPKTQAIGVGIAGQVNYNKGVFVAGPNLPKNFKNIPLAKILEKKFKIPVKIDNDAHCFTLAESIYGAAKGYNSVVGITLGTGIGGGIVINKKIYRGRDNIAGEIGHMTLNDAVKLKCGCGEVGHFEALASGGGMVNWYKKFTGKTKDTFFIENEAIKGEKNAVKVIKEMTKYLGIGLANIIHALNPDIIVVGGGMIRVKLLWRPALEETKKRVIFKSPRNTPIVKSKLGDGAGMLGASLLHR